MNIIADMYLMYKPSGKDVVNAKWIPLKKVHWFAYGLGQKINNTWEKQQNYEEHPTSVTVYKHPEWKSIKTRENDGNGEENGNE